MELPPQLPPPVTPPSPTPAPYRDRKGGLVTFGAVLIAFGGMFGLSVPAMFIAPLTARAGGNVYTVEHTPMDVSLMIPSAIIMALYSVACIWLGIGSINARRWARALILCGSWFAFVGGVLGLASITTMMDTIRQASAGENIPPEQQAVVTIVMSITMGLTMLMYIAVPLAFILFYRSTNVRLTCEARDPVERWTDRCPLPVLAACIFQAFGVISILFMPFYGGSFPVGGFVITGWPARLIWLGVSAFSFYAARGFYRCDLRVWKAYLVAMLLFAANFTYSMYVLGVEGYYRASGMSEQHLALFMKSPMLSNGYVVWFGLLSVSIYFGYIFYLRRYFRKAT